MGKEYPDEHGFAHTEFIIYIHNKGEEATAADYDKFMEEFNKWCIKHGYSFETLAPQFF